MTDTFRAEKSTKRRRGAPRTPPPDAGVGLVVGVVAGLFVAGLVYLVSFFTLSTLAVVLAMVVGLAAGLVAITRFDWFVLGLLVARPMFDLLGQGGTTGGMLDPAAAVGAMFVLTATAWLLAQHRAGLLRPPSAVTWAMAFLAFSCVASAAGSAERFGTVENSVRVVAGVLMFAVLEQLLADRRRLKPFVVGIIASAAVPVLVGVHQWTQGGVIGEDGVGRVQGTFAHPNPFATYLVMVFLLAIAVLPHVERRLHKNLLRLTILGVGAMVLATYTRVAWVAAIAGLLYLGVRHNRRILRVMFVVLLLVIPFVPSVVSRLSDLSGDAVYVEGVPDNSLEWRMQYWSELLPLSRDSRVFGIGLEMIQRTTDEGLQPHNVFVQALVELGAVGLLALISVLVTMAAHLRRRVKAAVSPLDRSLALAAVAVAIALLIQLPSENLLTQTMAYWYAAACMTFGLRLQPAPEVQPA